MQVLIALDQLVNTLLWFLPGGCWADETFSARCWRMRRVAPFSCIYPMIDAIFFWQHGHCQLAYESERLRLHLPPEERLAS